MCICCVLRCWGSDHGVLLGAVFVPMLLCYIVGIPLFVWLYLRRNKEKVMRILDAVYTTQGQSLQLKFSAVDVEALFERIDVDGDGTLTLEEFRQGVFRVPEELAEEDLAFQKLTSFLYLGYKKKSYRTSRPPLVLLCPSGVASARTCAFGVL